MDVESIIPQYVIPILKKVEFFPLFYYNVCRKKE